MKKSFAFPSGQIIRPIVPLAVTVFSIVSASADQSNHNCNTAVSTYKAITEFDKQAVENRYRICGTPALMAREQMRVACSKVWKIHNGKKKIIGDQEPR